MYFPIVVGPDGSFRWFNNATKQVCVKHDYQDVKLHFDYLYMCIDFLSEITNEQLVGGIYDQHKGVFLPKRIIGIRLETNGRWYDADAIKEKIKWKKTGD